MEQSPPYRQKFMSSNAKKTHTEHTSRFNFYAPEEFDCNQTATIKDLLEELLYESTTTTSGKSKNTDGKQINIRQLKTSLRLLRSISAKPLKRISEKHPIKDIKTIKTLHTHSHDSGIHLIALLEPPGKNSQVVFDLLSSPPTEEMERVINARESIINELQKEIPEDEKEMIGSLVGDKASLRNQRMGINEAVDDILLDHLHVDHDSGLLIESDKYLINKTKEYTESITSLQREKRLHVATYIHMKTLESIHYLHLEIATNRSIPNDKSVDNTQIDFSRICKSIPPVKGVTIRGETPFMTLDDFDNFCANNFSEISKLVSSATGFTYNRRDILNEKERARARYALATYLNSIHIKNEENPKPIAVVHVIAAFCSVLHQRKLKSKQKKSRRFGTKLNSPQKQLDAFIVGKAKYLASSASYIYSERTMWYTHAMLGRRHMYSSFRLIQLEQAKLFRHIYSTLYHRQITKAIDDYRNYMVKAAKDFVALHGKQHIVYQRIHGLPTSHQK